MAELTIQEILDEKEAGLDLELLAGAGGLANVVSSPRIQKPGLALAGYHASLHPARVQILGSTELSFLAAMPHEKAVQQVRQLCSYNLSCLIITKHQKAPAKYF